MRDATVEVGIQNASRIRKIRYPLCGPDKTERLYQCVVTVAMIDAIVVPLRSMVGLGYRKASLAATPAFTEQQRVAIRDPPAITYHDWSTSYFVLRDASARDRDRSRDWRSFGELFQIEFSALVESARERSAGYP